MQPNLLISCCLWFFTISLLSISSSAWADWYDTWYCSDPDGGYKIYLKHSSGITLSSSIGVLLVNHKQDQCCNSNTLIEYSCINSNGIPTGSFSGEFWLNDFRYPEEEGEIPLLREYWVRCQYGCQDGKCRTSPTIRIPTPKPTPYPTPDYGDKDDEREEEW